VRVQVAVECHDQVRDQTAFVIRNWVWAPSSEGQLRLQTWDQVHRAIYNQLVEPI
jgi:hypothetical protein